jgi:hypothetical protein
MELDMTNLKGENCRIYIRILFRVVILKIKLEIEILRQLKENFLIRQE